MMQITYGSK